ncbi:hypothetical protein KKE34_01740 [Patescibacteria group bacterium]|nr:hypothetical protein [Patescibacteria group bacterium]
MRRREKFVVTSILLSLGLLGVAYVSLELRYWAVGLLSMLSFFMSAWALADDLQPHEWFTIVPFPALYAAAVGLFYFLLPESFVSKLIILGIFGVGMYALFLTSNIYSVAKGRTIQLLHAAHAIGLLFTLLTSLLFTNTVFGLRLPFYLNGLLVGLLHFPLVLMSLWSVKLENYVSVEISALSGVLTLFLIELALILSFYPFSQWNMALFIMAFLYVGLGILHNFLKERLFKSTLREYSLVMVFIVVMFIIFFPYK